jgi:hypothetical protein
MILKRLSIPTLIHRRNDGWKRRLFARLSVRLTLRSLAPVSLYLLLLLAVCEPILRSPDAFIDTFRRVARQPSILLERRRVSGCEFEQAVPGWNDLLRAISKRVPDSEKILFLPLGPDSHTAGLEQNHASCVLTYELFPRPIVQVPPHNKRQIDEAYLNSIARSHHARYLILYRGSGNDDLPFTRCRFGEDLFLVDTNNEMRCEHDN